MKKLSTYLFLILFSFSAPSFGDDVQDFEYVEKVERGTIDHPDYDGVTTNDIFFLLKTGEVLMINCTDYSNKDNEAGDEDLFRIGLWTEELNKLLANI